MSDDFLHYETGAAELDNAAGMNGSDDDQAKARVPSREQLIATAADMEQAELTPRCFIKHHTYADVAQLIAPGGTGKTTVMLYELVCLVLGREVWGCKVVTSGWALIITAEDERERLLARLREICAELDLSAEELAEVRANVAVWDVTGRDLRLLYAHDGNIALSALADDIVEAHRADPPAVVIFDPAVSFGVSEERVNTNEQALITAARRIIRGLHCCVRYVHHTGQAVARERILDQYAGRGGTALADGSRMVTVLQVWEPGDSKLIPPPGCTPEPGSSIMVLARPKLSYAPPNLPHIWIKRTGYSFEYFYATDEDADKRSDEAAEKLYAYLNKETVAGRYWTKTALEESGHAGMARATFRKALATLQAAGKVVDMPLPKQQRQGSRKHFLCPICLADKLTNSAESAGGVGDSAENP